MLIELEYSLTRRQRLIPHLVIWLPYMPFMAGSLVAAFFLASSVWFVLMAMVALWFTRGFFVGLADIIICSERHADIVIEENGLGYLAGGERWYILLEGIINIGKICSDVWTVYHHNGTVINIPDSAITPEQLDLLQSLVQRARAR